MKHILIVATLLLSATAFSQKSTDSLDFYYSYQHAQHMGWLNSFGGGFSPDNRDNRIRQTYVKGKPYTECIDVGRKPMTSNFKDLVFVMRATWGDIELADFYYWSDPIEGFNLRKPGDSSRWIISEGKRSYEKLVRMTQWIVKRWPNDTLNPTIAGELWDNQFVPYNFDTLPKNKKPNPIPFHYDLYNMDGSLPDSTASKLRLRSGAIRDFWYYPIDTISPHDPVNKKKSKN